MGEPYLAIIITIIPLWAILTTLIVFILLTFHKHLRATKIYDDCTKQTAQFVYYVEIRTGDTSSTYNRRRTVITIDLFDDNQTSLARLTIPGHVIFGRKELPTPVIEDEKFFELRVTRFWLYRAVKLKKVSTIRITHSCQEHDARIMIYGFQIRTCESEVGRAKQFFPVMSYISAFGSTSKPNACFDSEQLGSISSMGGQQEEGAYVSGSLSRIDYTILAFLLAALIWLMASFPRFIISGDSSPVNCIYRGLLNGLIAYTTTFLLALLIRYTVKNWYAQKIGTGLYAIIYYLSCASIIALALGIWIFTTIRAYKKLRPEYYSDWVLTIAVAIIEVVALASINAAAIWLIGLLNPKTIEHYQLPEDLGQTATPPLQLPPVQTANPLQLVPDSKIKQMNYGYYSSSAPKQYIGPKAPGGAHWSTSGPVASGTGYQQHLMAPHQGYPLQQQPQGPIYSAGGQPSAAQMLAILNGPQTAYKAVNYGPSPLPNSPMLVPGNPYSYNQAPAMQQQPAPDYLTTPNYQNHNNVSLQGIKATNHGGTGLRKVGSSESTGSTYYQQLMKNKGGVKSISQYGELLKQKKQQQPAHGARK